MDKQKPGLAQSPMTGRFYFVPKYGRSGAAIGKVDVTEQVDNIASHARGPLEDAIQEAFGYLSECNEADENYRHELLHNIDAALRAGLAVDWKNPQPVQALA